MGALALRLLNARAVPPFQDPEKFRDWILAPLAGEPIQIQPRCSANTTQLRESLITQLALQVTLSSLDQVTLEALVVPLRLDLASGRYLELAEDLARVWFTADKMHDDSPPLAIARLLVDLTRTSAGDRVVCIGTEIDPAAVVCFQTGRVPIISADVPSYFVLLYAMLTDALFELLPAADLHRVSAPRIILPPRTWSDGDLTEVGALEEGLRNAERRTILLVSNRPLFARAAPAVSLRRQIVDSGRTEAIIGFPAGALTRSQSTFSVVVFSKAAQQPSEQTLFIKADEQSHFTYAKGKLRTRESEFTGSDQILEAISRTPPDVSWCRQVPNSEIAEHDYVLAADRYLGSQVQRILRLAGQSPGRSLVTLGDLATISKAQTLRSSELPSAVSVGEVSPGEFPQFGWLQQPLRIRGVDFDDFIRNADQTIRNNDVLLSTKGTIGRTAIAAPASPDLPIVASPSTVIIRLLPRAPIVDPVVLLMLLRAPTVQALLNSLVVGTTIPNVSLFDLRKLPLVVPSHLEAVHLHQVFDKQVQLQREITELKDQQTKWARGVWTELGLGEPESNS